MTLNCLIVFHRLDEILDGFFTERHVIGTDFTPSNPVQCESQQQQQQTTSQHGEFVILIAAFLVYRVKNLSSHGLLTKTM